MYHKLVRDKIPSIIKANGENPIVEILDDIHFVREQKKNERGGFSKKIFLKDVR